MRTVTRERERENGFLASKYIVNVGRIDFLVEWSSFLDFNFETDRDDVR